MMRSRTEIENDIESSYIDDDDGSVQHCKADDEDMQALIIEVLLDIRELLQMYSR